MKIRFGMSLDGFRPLQQESELGHVTVGPNGLLQLLEVRLGMAGAWLPETVRIAQFQRCLDEADDGARFYSASFQVDALAVAETLLGWRDEWVAAGWDGTASESDSPRIRHLAEVERIARDRLASGVGDRLRAVVQVLDNRAPGIDEVQVVDALVDLPRAWRRILDRLPTVNADTPQFGEVRADTGSDLARLQHALLTNTPVTFQEDGSFFLIFADSEQTLARGVSGAFADPRGWKTKDTTVVTGPRAAAFEQSLALVDLPRPGQSPSSPWRPAPQVLRLALSLLWDPLDPHRLLEFLAHPVCPVRQPLRARLASVVAEAPGIGGPAWRHVIAEAQAEAVGKAHGDESAGNLLKDQVATWLEVERFDPVAGAPVEILAEHCARVSRWAGARAGGLVVDDPLRPTFLIAQVEAMSAATAIDELKKGGSASLSRSQLDRLIDQVTTAGSSRPDIVAERAHVHAVVQPGAVVEPVGRVVWWDFSAPPLLSPWPWSPEEISQLQAHGVELLSVDNMLQTEARRWLQPVLSARDQLILVVPRRRGRDSVVAHPLFDQVVALTEDERVPRLDLDQVIEGGFEHPWLVAASCQVPHRGLPAQRRWWMIRNGKQLATREEESFSSLRSFVNEPHQWVLRYKAKLYPGSLAAIQADNRQKGALLHRMFEWMFGADQIDWRIVDKDCLTDWIDTRFPELLRQEGGNLLLPGQGRDAEALRKTAIDASWAMLNQLRASGAELVQLELPGEGSYCGGRLTGRIDVLVANKNGREAVLDLKWGGFKYRCEELRENRQLQLAVYAVMRRQETGSWPSEGYFVLSEGRLLAQQDDYFANADLCASNEEYASTPALWAAFETVWKWRRSQLDEGLVEVNVEGAEPDDRSVPPEGGLAIAGANDRFDEYARLAGWPEGA